MRKCLFVRLLALVATLAVLLPLMGCPGGGDLERPPDWRSGADKVRSGAVEIPLNAVHVDNADFTYHPVGKKKANPWGLFDMHGNACEWTLDAYLPDYKAIKDGSSPLTLSPLRYPRVTRGGHWKGEPQEYFHQLRVAMGLGEIGQPWPAEAAATARKNFKGAE